MPSISRQSAAALLRRAAVFGLVALLMTACAPAAAVEQAPGPPQAEHPDKPLAAAVVTPLPTGTATRAPTPTAEQTTAATAVPTRTQTPTLPPGQIRAPAGRVDVPVLLYHHISDKGDPRYSTTPQKFRAQMRLLHEAGYQTTTITHLAGVIRSGGALPEKAVVLTFDDGYMDVYENAFPILQEFGFTGVAYIITSTLEKDKSYGYMQERELKALLAAGWEIGSHSVTHSDLKKTKLGAGNEVRRSKAVLEALLGVPVRSFCYPFGVANQSIKDLVLQAGYDSAVGLGITPVHTPERLYYLSRREVTGDMTIEEFRSLLELPRDTPTAKATSTRTPRAQ